jgi:hypothetical protein
MGRQLRALRRRKRLRQRDVAALAHGAQSTVSLVERGHADRVTLRRWKRSPRPSMPASTSQSGGEPATWIA